MWAPMSKRQSHDPGFSEEGGGDAYTFNTNFVHDISTRVDVDFIKLDRRELCR